MMVLILGCNILEVIGVWCEGVVVVGVKIFEGVILMCDGDGNLL